jgi:transcriptional regulator NrdR family protein
MTDVIKRNGKKEIFKPQKLRKSIESAVSDAGFTVTKQMKAIEHATQDAENLARGRNEIKSQELRNEIVNDLESDAPEVAQAWRNYEKQHGMKWK